MPPPDRRFARIQEQFIHDLHSIEIMESGQELHNVLPRGQGFVIRSGRVQLGAITGRNNSRFINVAIFYTLVQGALHLFRRKRDFLANIHGSSFMVNTEGY